MSTLATFGTSKDHARERAGVLSGGAAVGRLSGLGLARMPEGGTRRVCPGTVVEFPYVVEHGQGYIKAVLPNGIPKAELVVHAGPEDEVIYENGVVIGRVPGCGIGRFLVGSCEIRPLSGGNPTVITAPEYPYPPGLIRTYCVGLDQWGEYSTGTGAYNQLIQANSLECGWLPPIPNIYVTLVSQNIMAGYKSYAQNYGPALFDIRVPGAVAPYPLTIEVFEDWENGNPGDMICLPFSQTVLVGDSNVRIQVPLIDYKTNRTWKNGIPTKYYKIRAKYGAVETNEYFGVSENPYALKEIWVDVWSQNKSATLYTNWRNVVNGVAGSMYPSSGLGYHGLWVQTNDGPTNNPVLGSLSVYAMIFGISPPQWVCMYCLDLSGSIMKDIPGADANGMVWTQVSLPIDPVSWPWDPIADGSLVFSCNNPDFASVRYYR